MLISPLLTPSTKWSCRCRASLARREPGPQPDGEDTAVPCPEPSIHPRPHEAENSGRKHLDGKIWENGPESRRALVVRLWGITRVNAPGHRSAAQPPLPERSPAAGAPRAGRGPTWAAGPPRREGPAAARPRSPPSAAPSGAGAGTAPVRRPRAQPAQPAPAGRGGGTGGEDGGAGGCAEPPAGHR